MVEIALDLTHHFRAAQDLGTNNALKWYKCALTARWIEDFPNDQAGQNKRVVLLLNLCYRSHNNYHLFACEDSELKFLSRLYFWPNTKVWVHYQELFLFHSENKINKSVFLLIESSRDKDTSLIQDRTVRQC